jgi:hypothetical protein
MEMYVKWHNGPSDKRVERYKKDLEDMANEKANADRGDSGK